MVKYRRDRDPVVGDPEGDVDAESDCEGDSPDVADGVSGAPEGEGPALPRAVLTVGSLSAYEYSRPSISWTWLKQRIPQVESLFFYCCTNEISFAPLRSQGVDFRKDYIRKKTVATAPPPCSPKSIYVLANLVRQPPSESFSQS